MKKSKLPYLRELIAFVFLGVIYGAAVLVTGQTCAVAYYQPPTPDKLYDFTERRTSI